MFDPRKKQTGPGIPGPESGRSENLPVTYIDALRLHFDFDLARLGRLLLGKGNGEHAILVLGPDLVRVERVGDGETADEVAVAPLDAVEPFAGIALLELALTGDGQRLVLDPDIDGVPGHIRQIGLEHEFVPGLINVDCRAPRPVVLRFVEQSADRIFKQTEIR